MAIKITAILIFFVSFCFVGKVLFNQTYPDFYVYYTATKVFFTGGNPYLANQDFFTNFSYPPFILLLFAPLLVFSIAIAGKIWVMCSILFLFLSIMLLYKLPTIHLFSVESIIITSLILWMFPVKFTLGMGQVNLLILLLLTLCMYFKQKNKPTVAGIFLGLSIAIKLFPIAIILYLLFTKQWKIFLVTTITTTLSYFITFFIHPAISIYFFHTQFFPTFFSIKADYYNQALSGVIARMAIQTGTAIGIRIICTMLVTVVTIGALYLYRKENQQLLISLVILVSLLTNPFSWQHHFVWSIIPLLCVYCYLRAKQASFWQYIILILSYILIATNLPKPQLYWGIIQDHVFIGSLLLWSFILYLLSLGRYSERSKASLTADRDLVSK